MRPKKVANLSGDLLRPCRTARFGTDQRRQARHRPEFCATRVASGIARSARNSYGSGSMGGPIMLTISINLTTYPRVVLDMPKKACRE